VFRRAGPQAPAKRSSRAGQNITATNRYSTTTPCSYDQVALSLSTIVAACMIPAALASPLRRLDPARPDPATQPSWPGAAKPCVQRVCSSTMPFWTNFPVVNLSPSCNMSLYVRTSSDACCAAVAQCAPPPSSSSAAGTWQHQLHGVRHVLSQCRAASALWHRDRGRNGSTHSADRVSRASTRLLHILAIIQHNLVRTRGAGASRSRPAARCRSRPPAAGSRSPRRAGSGGSCRWAGRRRCRGAARAGAAAASAQKTGPGSTCQQTAGGLAPVHNVKQVAT